MINYVILGMLMESPMSGYDLKKVTEQTIGMFFKMSYGNLYPTLKTLTSSGEITEQETLNSKNKKIYTITDQGKASFIQWLAGPLQRDKKEYMVKIFFYDYLDEESRRMNLMTYQGQTQRTMMEMKALQDIVDGELASIPNKEDYYYRVSTMYYGLQFFEMELAWLNKLITKDGFQNEK